MKNKMGESIRSLRKQKKKTLREVAVAINVTHSYLSRLERGLKKPSMDMIEKLADYFDVHKSYFFLEDDKIEEMSTGEKILTFEKDLSIENLKEKYNITHKGKPVSDDELKVMITVLESYRDSQNIGNKD
ncbi:helix-turn-helix domain-containing protein [Bacillus stratosphericus]|uniref:helix-turn-helix domain-containing protein n=1 Tax=Bacillus stratosphericus TaxID=293386 RepID=UPI001CFAA388|nr:helix-turn-helix transcriptional regulator [Bacillus stratosphericus]